MTADNAVEIFVGDIAEILMVIVLPESRVILIMEYVNHSHQLAGEVRELEEAEVEISNNYQNIKAR